MDAEADLHSTARKEMVALVRRWLMGDLTTQEFDALYWVTRRRLINLSPKAFTGAFGTAMSDVDVALDASTNDPRTPFWIPESQMRQEIEAAMSRLRNVAPHLFE